MKDTYKRRIGSEEEAGNFLFISKIYLPMFPKKSFKINKNKNKFDCEIRAVLCSCVLPEHRHYHLYIKGVKFKKGSIVEIDLKGKSYSLSIK
jgi:hypothetical protein